MDFFSHQDRARRQTRRMLWLFALAVIAIVIVIDLVLLFAFGSGAEYGNSGISGGGLAVVSVLVLTVIGVGSLYRIASLRGGGAVVARELGGVPVPTDTGNFTYRRLRNVVEEIAIAAGVPVPEIFVLEEEAGINAFASGYAPADAAVTVSRGALDKLTREELQGVIGHEFSHLLNGDMRLNIRLMGVIFGILVISVIGRKIAEVSGRGRSSGPALLGLALFAAGYIGVIFARMIKASISRQREFLADASAVQLTRQTEGIGGALKKIAALAEGSKLSSGGTEQVAHMLFSDGVGYSALFATHPPLAARILRLDPSFRSEQFKDIAATWSQPVATTDLDDERPDLSISGLAPATAGAAAPARRAANVPAADARLYVTPQGVAGQVGNPGVDDRLVARGLHAAIPERLRRAAWQPEQAMTLMFALLLNDEAEMRRRQLELIFAHYDIATRDAVAALVDDLADLHPMQRLPLAALAFPALRRRPRPQLTKFMIVMRALIDADQRVTLGEYCLATLIRVQVMDALNPAATQTMGRTRLPEIAGDLKDVLAVVARYGNDDARTAARAYALGLQEVLPGSAIDYSPPLQWASALDRSLPKIDLLAPAGKELVVRALTSAISADGMVSVAESELLRTICAALHCPLPPLLQSGRDDALPVR